MKKSILLISLILFLPSLMWAQGGSGIGGGGTNVGGGLLVQQFPGAPSGTCSTGALAQNAATGALYDCVAGVWTLVGGGGGNPGTVTSVSLTVPSWLTVAGSPVTTSGTLAVTATTAQTSHQVIGTCNATTTFAPCTLVAGDLPAGTTTTICSGSKALGTSAISSGAAATTVTQACTGLLTTDNIMLDFNGSPLAVTGYVPSASGILTIIKWPTADTINISVVNNTGGSITPGAITLNYRVTR